MACGLDGIRVPYSTCAHESRPGQLRRRPDCCDYRLRLFRNQLRTKLVPVGKVTGAAGLKSRRAVYVCLSALTRPLSPAVSVSLSADLDSGVFGTVDMRPRPRVVRCDGLGRELSGFPPCFPRPFHSLQTPPHRSAQWSEHTLAVVSLYDLTQCSFGLFAFAFSSRCCDGRIWDCRIK